tara:strand:+ start:1191 stop:2456 length:1266 start_codon:yes stop_codon:yes gene_type:complete
MLINEETLGKDDLDLALEGDEEDNELTLDELLDEIDLDDLEEEEEIDEVKADHSGTKVVPGAEIEGADKKNADDPKADKKKKGKDETSLKQGSSGEKIPATEEKAPSTKAGMINAIMDEMKGMKKAELESVFGGALSALSLDEDDSTDDEDEEFSEKTLDDYKKSAEDFDFQEDLEAIFSTEEISEGEDEGSWKEKATLLFEAAVVSKVNGIAAEMHADHEQELTEAKEQIVEELSEKVDSYLEYVIEKWLEENELAVEAGIRSELAEDFITDLRGVFVEHYIDVPEDKVDIVEELGNQVYELQAKLDEEIEKNIELSGDVETKQKDEVLADVAEGLAATDSEKLRSLSEGIDFETEEDYREKLETVKEQYFPNGEARVRTTLNEEDTELDKDALDDEEENQNIDPTMARYVESIGNTLIQ